MSLERVTTVLDLAGLVLLAFGIGAALFPLVGLACVTASAVVLLAGSRVIVWVSKGAVRPKWLGQLGEWVATRLRRLRGGEGT
ncbi:hypothetical protein [Lentzea albida]|uniref:Uncharacterized protein n=1 Tax=Lentzea albida TaxID=65499 RepID=A0A1H9VGW6_9PSEU|nr:hypothetical protein [Lentzea albida]SES21050.1 hypothetical protein SAMN04488000_118122 [Lentzea albida]